MTGRSRAGARVQVREFRHGSVRRRSDLVATEEPLEIRLRVAGRPHRVAVTMRTPGADFELAAGFLYGEGIVRDADDIAGIDTCVDGATAEQHFNVVSVTLRSGRPVDLRGLERHFFTSSACGVCGNASLEQLELRGCRPLAPGPTVAPDVITALPERLRKAQGLFDATGGLHAAGLFDSHGQLIVAREDVGRHNAVDKLVGWALMDRRLPLGGAIVAVSGRTSFEIVQKCLTAGAPVLCAVSAPSSLAVDVALAYDMTLVGFVRDGRFNVYSGLERLGA